MHTHFLHSEQGGGSICAQFHNMLSARTAVQPVSQLTREGLIEIFGGCPSVTSGLIVSRLLKHTGDRIDRAVMRNALFLYPFLGHYRTICLRHFANRLRSSERKIFRKLLLPNCPVAPISYYTSTTAYIEVRQYGIMKQERFVREFCGPTRRDRSSRKKPQLSLFRAA